MRRALHTLLAAALALGATLPARAGVGMTQLAGLDGDGPVTVFYPTAAPDTTLQRGPYTLQLAPDAAPDPGNRHLVVVSHGSGAIPWVQSDIARALVEAGFTVALPEHQGDNARDPSHPGPPSWLRRPAEVSRTIDAMQADARWAGMLDLQHVGVWGMSAGGHTALSIAGGVWSPARFRDHCLAHLQDDWPACAPLWMGRRPDDTGSSLRAAVLGLGLRLLFDDATPQQHVDPRIAAVVAGVPAAADFDPASLATPRVPLALVTAQRDAWLNPALHAGPILAACLPRCTWLADLAGGGHGALLSPLPPLDGLPATLRGLIADPPGFDRAAELPAVHAKIVGFFRRHLLDTPR